MAKKFLKNRTVLGIASIVLALVISFGITPLLSNAMKSQVEIVRAGKDIKKGEKITSDKVIKIKVGGYNLPGSVIKKSDDVVGKYAKENIYKDDYFLSSKISNVKSNIDSYLYDLGEDKMAVSITIKNFAAGLSGKLKPGDIVSVISTNEDKSTSIVPELRYVEVLAVTTKEGADKEERDIEKEEEEELPATVTLIVGDVQAEKLIMCEQSGNIHLALVYRGLEKEKYLQIQDEYIQSIKQGGENSGEVEEDADTKVEFTQNTNAEIEGERQDSEE
ncbi:Flp pilus assembly protein CpaB [Sporanaerobacter acetigenes]|uniref:Pilus assembly protein CpaB n=1 Tax=Sporanaerobacter acetigenes DSM 13106 TaxID=1123281 RepID=A0A1M5U884_9FIRM|nr:Flp pilus assembly protein CpaB [Sporanaerobacter acetigenes]SHH59128.1 pilus assembly protein CpaB [Sporanaerobacter acetigenes DSM 13106]